MPKSPLTARNICLPAVLTAVLLAAGASLGTDAAAARTVVRSSPHALRVHRVARRLSALEEWHYDRAWRSPKHVARKHRSTNPPAKESAGQNLPTATAAGTPGTPGTTTTAPTATTAQASSPQPAGIPGNWNLVMDSEFNGPSLNTSIWRTGWFGSGVTAPVNSFEAACYSPNNVTFPGDGTMHLNVTATPSTCGGETRPYTGALVSTNPNDGRSSGGFQYTYGAMEARVYIPADGNEIANWPAVWTDGQSWPNDGEDDLMEGLGGQACYHFHDPLGGPGNCDATLTPGWHTFASDWQPGSVTYYYDGVNVGSITTGITTAPMYIILNNAVSPGEPNATEADSMQVAYVRVWQS